METERTEKVRPKWIPSFMDDESADRLAVWSVLRSLRSAADEMARAAEGFAYLDRHPDYFDTCTQDRGHMRILSRTFVESLPESLAAYAETHRAGWEIGNR